MLMSDITFVLDTSGGADILRNNEDIRLIEDDAMRSLLQVIEAQFFQEFGVPGSFTVIDFTTDRYSVKISAADANTSRILLANPKWLDQFIQNIKI